MRDEQPLDQDAGVSDVARALSSIAPALSAVTRRHLSALLAHTIASPTAAEIRGRRLGLVCEMVSEPGALGVQRYEALRSARTGEGWPAASTLIAHFGSWQAVLTVAMRLQQYGQSLHPIRGSHRALHNSARNYSRAEVVCAINQAADVIGRIPSLAEYVEIRRVLLAHARRTGGESPRLPERHTICRQFASYQDAARAAARQAGRDSPSARRRKDAGAKGPGSS